LLKRPTVERRLTCPLSPLTPATNNRSQTLDKGPKNERSRRQLRKKRKTPPPLLNEKRKKLSKANKRKEKKKKKTVRQEGGTRTENKTGRARNTAAESGRLVKKDRKDNGQRVPLGGGGKALSN